MRFIAHRRLARPSALIWASFGLLSACAARYAPPHVPVQELALVTLDDRATVLTAEGLEPRLEQRPGTKQFRLESGCRELVVKYEESHSTLKIDAMSDSVVEMVAKAASSEEHHYQTFKPIRFLVPVKRGTTYWVTATFTGDEFLPRIVELAPSGEAAARFEPDGKCP